MSNQLQPIDQQELEEWRAAVEDIVSVYGQECASALLQELMGTTGTSTSFLQDSSGYRNTYDSSSDECMPDQDYLGERAEKINLWNAMAMVVRAGTRYSELGGHISTYASCSTLYRIGFDYFFKGDESHEGDLVYFQGHASPGIYARSFLEGRLTKENLELFRQEAVDQRGISSYPHPWLMPDYWQFPTVSMGLGPLQAIYQADWQRYLAHRGLSTDNQRIVWAFCGDGEMDEPESTAALTHAAREKLDNCVFVVNCNLQRLDGPVRGNGQIITELERTFSAAGWRVIKLIWGQGWDRVWQLDKEGLVQQAVSQLVDGQLQSLYARGARALVDHLITMNPKTAEVFTQLSDDELDRLLPGGHDPVKVYTAFRHAVERTGKPTVVLAFTIKGFQLGGKTHARNTAHNKKKMSTEDLQAYANWLEIPMGIEEIESASFYHPGERSSVVNYIQERRRQLKGFLPKRRASQQKISEVRPDLLQKMIEPSGDKKLSTTMAYVRLLNICLRDEGVSRYLVPIVADEARTFGMEGLFKKVGIYASSGQLYQPEDAGSIMCYQESQAGQLIQAGLTEAGAIAAWISAATSYSSSNQPMIPMYIFYSMFGFQRVGDLLWLAGDIRARGFLFGATAGRTTLGGEGLQHNDGNSLSIAALVPNCISYDPCYQYELAIIMTHGIKRMMTNGDDVFYYITLMNENYMQPEMPKGAEEGIVNGMYVLADQDDDPDIQLLGSGAILREVEQAGAILRQMGFRVKICSVTSFTELARQAQRNQRQEILTGASQKSHIEMLLEESVPVLAATDYVRSYADQVRAYIKSPYLVLGTDGFGRSDSRKNLRDFYGVDAQSIVYHSVWHLVQCGKAQAQTLESLRGRVDKNRIKRDPAVV